ncbi:hypothetical protein [Synechococcus sp. CC9311]|uniref:hypothetical protein n=1 Tax=Synechococcus sp. (strain CC9311) TaxID=64471 RepID=UPI0000DDAB44|nr:hypothetical protein [Synechococcus sp. CC9311]ABI45965.1 hypothetical protein sync_0584 [Synechococcus sp. CC9311]
MESKGLIQMKSHGLYGQPISKDEAKNQFKEICLLRQDFLAQNPYARKGEAMDWAIESYFSGIKSRSEKSIAV